MSYAARFCPPEAHSVLEEMTLSKQRSKQIIMLLVTEMYLKGKNKVCLQKTQLEAWKKTVGRETEKN